MSAPLLILVSGPPAAGKTTLGRRLAREFSLPFFSKDDLKERLFDTLGWSDRAWSRKLGLACMALLFGIVERHLEVGGAVMAESNFDPQYDTPTLEALRRKYDMQVVEIHCVADPAVLLARFHERDRGGRRHPGHRGNTPPETLEAGLIEALGARHRRPVAPFGRTLTVDTTDLSALDEAPVRAAIRQALEWRDG